jgi:hypothetical protein
MKKGKVCKDCQVREDVHKTITGEKFKKGVCKGCQ